MNQQELAKALGVSYVTISQWETGNRSPDITMVKNIADYFSISVDRLLGNTISTTILPQGGNAERIELTQEDLKVLKALAETFKNNFNKK